MMAFGRSSGGGRRDSSREAAPLCVVLTGLSKTYEAVLVDLSATGARVRSSKLPSVGDDLYLSVCKVKAFCIVRWQRGDECGVRFDEPLLQDEVMSVRREVLTGAGLPTVFRAALDDWVLGIAR